MTKAAVEIETSRNMQTSEIQPRKETPFSRGVSVFHNIGGTLRSLRWILLQSSFHSFLGVKGCGVKVAETVGKKIIYFNTLIKRKKTFCINSPESEIHSFIYRPRVSEQKLKRGG